MKDRFKELRKSKGLSQDEFAAKLGLTRGAITNIELGKVEPKPKFIDLVCNTFGVNELWLRTGEGEMFAPVSKEEEIADFVGGLLAGGSESFKRRFVYALAQLPEEAWEAVEAFCRKVLEESDE